MKKIKDNHKTLTEKIEEYGYIIYISLFKLIIEKDKKKIKITTLSTYDSLVIELKNFHNKISRTEKIKRLYESEKDRNKK